MDQKERRNIQTVALHILVVESSEEDFQALSAVLGQLKAFACSVERSHSYVEAITHLQTSRYDVCLLASQPGRTDVAAFLQETQKMRFAAPVIILSSQSSRDDDLAALRAGAADYLYKEKIRPAFLERAIRYALERKRSSDENLKIEKQILHAQKMKALGQLAASIAEDLSNTLGHIQGQLEVIRVVTADHADVQEAVAGALQSCRQSSLLIDHLVAYSDSENEMSHMVDVQQLLTDTVDFLSRIVRPEITVTGSIAGAEKPKIAGSSSLIRQALINVAMNATEAIPGRGNIHISYGTVSYTDHEELPRRAAPGRYVQIRIRDNGNGIPAELLDRVFQPTFTSKNSITGLGLGLLAVDSIMQRHGGWAAIESQLGSGTTVTLSFPAAASRSPAVEVDAAAEKRLIVVIDDEPVMLKLMSLYLTAGGYGTRLFVDPEQALTWYRGSWRQVDLVMLDMKMPNMDGKECFQALREINPKAQVVICSRELDHDGKELLEAGAVKFFQKPGKYPLIVTWVSEFLEQAS